jgi:hypothetical protein
MKELKSDNRRRKHGREVLSLISMPTDTARDIRLLLVHGSPESVSDVLALKRLRGYPDKTSLFSEVLSENPCYRISHLSIRGDDLTKLGFTGKEIGETLSALLLAVADERVKNEKEALLKLALELK